MFEPAELARLAPRSRSQINLAERNGQGIAGLDPVAGTEAIAYDFLSKGGKHSRPFITLAVYDAMTGGRGTAGDGAEFLASLPDSIRRAAMSIETFHKASLVHDDIEDDDAYRYGDQTLHQKYGIPTAINVGDYLIGLGYRLVSREAGALGADVAAEIVDRLADAHLKLSEGQGAELLWRDARDKRLKALDALKIYALKTAPAFEAAFYTGLRLAGPLDEYLEPIGQFARHLGVAFQILNDLKDWQPDADNKLSTGGDVVGGRPTLLLALALESLAAGDAQRLLELISQSPSPQTIADVRRLYESAGVFEKAARLVDKYQQRAEAIADEIQPDELRRLLYYLIDTVLERPAVESPTVFMPELLATPPAETTLR
jgi:geranylgeranyl pyrophosphate synthase